MQHFKGFVKVMQAYMDSLVLRLLPSQKGLLSPEFHEHIIFQKIDRERLQIQIVYTGFNPILPGLLKPRWTWGGRILLPLLLIRL